ncbi:MAG: fibronectin type III domain-containing protein [Cyclobacteriaceae bacterium]|nr:fibronectin type III domain-containing protein [Cyclobacteriaceae bacterium]
MECLKFTRSFWLVLLLGMFGACSNDDDPIQLTAPQLNDAEDVTTSGFTISWSEVSGANKYLLDIATDESFANKVEGYDRKEVTGTSAEVDDLEFATLYYIRVYAASNDGQSQPSATKQVTTEALLASPVLNEAEDISSTGFTISWTEVEGADEYLLDIATDEDFNDKIEGYDRKEVDGLSSVVEDLEPGTTYYIRVYAVQGEIESLPSDVASVTTEGEE